MKYYFLLSILFVSTLASAQSADITLTGTLLMATGEQFPYKIVAKESNNVITGYAYTFDNEATKAVIKGKVDKQNRKLTFKETEIVSTSSITTKAFMCLINATLESKRNTLTGSISTRQADNISCTEGTLTFNNERELTELFSSHDKYDQVITMGGNKPKETEKIKDLVPAPIETNTTPDKITAGIEKSYEWNTDSIVAEVWDGGNLDGDVVTILFDGKPVLNRYLIQKQRKKITIPLPATGTHTFTVVAVDEGSDPPNTATLMLYDGAQHYSLVAYNTKGQQSLIRIKRAAGR